MSSTPTSARSPPTPVTTRLAHSTSCLNPVLCCLLQGAQAASPTPSGTCGRGWEEQVALKEVGGGRMDGAPQERGPSDSAS